MSEIGMEIDALLELIGRDVPELIHPDEVTVQVVAEKFNMTDRGADNLLQEQVKKGILVMHWRRDEKGRRIKAFAAASCT